jgi:hypothetical protein
MIRRLFTAVALAALTWAAVFAQTKTMTQGAHRMELVLERYESDNWRAIDPALVLAQNDRVRFRFRSNFDGYLYVSNQGSSGKYEQLFPRQETGQDNRVASGRDYQVPSTSAVFRISGPAGYDTIYWLVTPARVNDAPPRVDVPSGYSGKPLTLTPRCDDAVLKARGECIDHAAGLKLVPRGEQMPDALAGALAQNRSDLLFLQQEGKAVISSAQPLTGPVIYEFRLAHR